jgi:hypothetical protein
MDEREQELKQRLREVEREIRAKRKDLEGLEDRLREEYEPQFKELVRYARRRKHTWLESPWLLMGTRRSDAERVEWLVEFATRAHALESESNALWPLEDQRAKLRSELREIKKRREVAEMFKRGK